jgi:hypothetical protein
VFAIDNNCGPGKDGRPGTAYPGDERYMTLIQALIEADGADLYDPFTSRCLFATAPDVVGDAQATLRRAYMLGWIRYAGLPAALVAQDGLEHLATPWDDFDALFLGGSTAWKLGPAARALSARRKAAASGSTWAGSTPSSGSGTPTRSAATPRTAPSSPTPRDANLPRLLGWLREVNDQAPLWEAA